MSKRTCLDHLASPFENLRTGDDETIGNLTAKLPTIVNEASMLVRNTQKKRNWSRNSVGFFPNFLFIK